MRTRLIILVLLAYAGLAVAGEPAAQPDRSVLLTRPVPLGNAPAWIGQAIQQNLTNEVDRLHHITAITPAGAGPAEPLTMGAAMDLARAHGVRYVFYGSYHATDADLRINAQVYDAQRGVIADNLKATGPMRDLFALEDDLSRQVKDLLALRPANPEIEPFVPAGIQQLAADRPLIQPRGPLMDDWAWLRHRAEIDLLLRRPLLGAIEEHRYRYYYTYPRYVYWGYAPIYCGPVYHRPYYHHGYHRAYRCGGGLSINGVFIFK